MSKEEISKRERDGKKINERKILGVIVLRKYRDFLHPGARWMPVSCEDICGFALAHAPIKREFKVPTVRRIVGNLEKRGLIITTGKRGKEKLYDLFLDHQEFIQDLAEGVKKLLFEAPKSILAKAFCPSPLYLSKASEILEMEKREEKEIALFIHRLLRDLCIYNALRMCERCEFAEEEQMKEYLKEFANERALQVKIELLGEDLRTLLTNISEHGLFGGISMKELELNRDGVRDQLWRLVQRNQEAIETLVRYERKKSNLH